MEHTKNAVVLPVDSGWRAAATPDRSGASGTGSSACGSIPAPAGRDDSRVFRLRGAVMVDFGPDTFVMRMTGASMAPWILDGDFVYVDPDEPAAAGRFVAVRDPESGEWTVRQLLDRNGRRVLRALAPEWQECVVDADNKTMIGGVVVFAGPEV